MQILVLGGTLFLGRHIVTAALRRGHHVTIFNRGQSASNIPAQVTVLRGDRDHDLRALRHAAFDVVVDTSAYCGAHIEKLAAVLDAVGHYIVISTASVYARFPASERTELHPSVQDSRRPVGPDSYAGLKRAAEDAAERFFGRRLTVVRPGVLVGPYDPTNRFEYWVRRCARGGSILAPGSPARCVQLLDARDLAEWIVAIAGKTFGVFNASGLEPLTMQAVLQACINASRSVAECVWVSDAFLIGQDVRPWLDLPLWVPGEAGPLLQLDSTRAHGAGLITRSLLESAHDVLATPPNRQPLAGGMPRATPIGAGREAELLTVWHRDRTA